LLYRDASEISSKKTEIIVRGSIEDLESLVKAEQAIILKIGQLESQREAVISKLSAELDLELSGINLSQITERLGEQSTARLNSCQDVLMSTLTGLKNKNETNEQLIQNALDYINFSVNVITSDRSGGISYSSGGEEDQAAGRKHIFDVKM
jgi:flagellar biosynthesis/type III secretory pathway chaperone